MSEHLLVFSLGPVQDFIATARRCQDLWYGSWLLSHLAGIAAETIGHDSVIFPSGHRPGDAVANKILAHLPAERDPSEVASAAARAVQVELRALAGELFERLTGRHFDRDLAMAQVDDLIEVGWVAVALPSRDAYDAARQQAERLLAARKNTRDWRQVSWSVREPRHKSSLDGMRESVLSEDVYRSAHSDERRRREYHVRPQERLCGIGMLKRLGEEQNEDVGTAGRHARPSFSSNTHVMAGPLFTRFARQHATVQPALAAYLQELATHGVNLDHFRVALGMRRQMNARSPFDGTEQSCPAAVAGRRNGEWLDGYVLIEDRLPDIFTQYGPGSDSPGVEPCRRALRSVFRSVGLGERINRYYAVLLADGDHMGKLINHLSNIEHHRELSATLAEFARNCRRTVEEAGGCLIYAGGDDVLALLPLHTALACARKLATDFGHALDQVTASDPTAPRPTLSVGLGVSHHMEPMTHALNTAREAERLAKVQRDSLAIVLDKRSGQTVSISARWSEQLDARLEGWANDLARERLPDGVVGHLEQIVASWRLSREPVSDEVVLAQARRAIWRRGIDRADYEAVGARLSERLSGHSGHALQAVADLARELDVARTFLRAWLDAWGTPQ